MWTFLTAHASDMLVELVVGLLLALILFVIPPCRRRVWRVLRSGLNKLRLRFGRIGKMPLEKRKLKTHILFVDDDRKYKIASILKSLGWIHVKRVDDLKSVDEENVTRAHILFIDIQGVGKSLQFVDEGLGLAHAIKKRYPDKFVIIYSGVSTGDRLHPALNTVDRILRKNASIYEFQSIIEELSASLKSIQ